MVNDLESITAGAGGDLYILASQSRTSKGKRPAARRIFLHLKRAVDGYEVTGERDLYTSLATLDAAGLERLGVSALDDLDIEGMTLTSSGLLLGLKAPLDGEGRALIWNVERPAVLLSGGSLEEAGLAPAPRTRAAARVLSELVAV